MSLILPPDVVRASGRWSGIASHSRGLISGPALLTSPRAGTGIASSGRLERTGLIRKDIVVADDLREFTDWVPWRKTYKIVIRAREGGETLWVRPFASEREASLVWAQLCHLDLDRVAQGGTIELPASFVEGELEYIFAIVVTFNASNTDNTHDWSNGGNLVPNYVNGVDYVAIAGGGAGGGADLGGGGGAGGYRAANGYAVTSGASVTITVGAAGVGTNTVSYGTNGGDTAFDVLTSTGGGAGGTDGANNPGKNGGSGGGAGSNVAGSGGTGVAGQGFAGGNEVGAGSTTAAQGGGGGSSQVGANGNGAGTGGKGGDGTTSSITGTPVTRAGGGGGGAWSGTGGGAGSGGATAGTAASNANTSNATANTGSGAGGVGYSGAGSTAQAGNGGTGVVIVSFNAINIMFRWDDSAENLIVAINKPRPVAY